MRGYMLYQLLPWACAWTMTPLGLQLAYAWEFQSVAPTCADIVELKLTPWEDIRSAVGVARADTIDMEL